MIYDRWRRQRKANYIINDISVYRVWKFQRVVIENFSMKLK